MHDAPTDDVTPDPSEPRPGDRIPPARLEDGRDVVDASVVLLTNFIPPYRLPLFEVLSDRVSSLAVLVSTPVEGNRRWLPDSGRLDARVQRTVTFRRPWIHPAGFADSAEVHFPWDTLVQLRRICPDVVVSGELGFRSLLSALYCRRSSRARLIIWATLSERTEQGRGRLRRMLRGWLLRQADRVIVNGASGERYVRTFGVPLDRIQRLPQSALPDFAAAGAVPRPSREKIRHLVFVGQLTERKGLMPFVRALDEWAQANPDRELTLTAAGSGPLLRALESFRPGGSLSLQVLGEVDRRELPRLLARADALVFPTLADEWGLVVNEAFAAGLPVMGSVHSQAVEELCDDGVNGWVFDPESRSSTNNAIDRALTASADSIFAMRERARERVIQLTPEWAAERLVDSIQSVQRIPSRYR